jgi:hypothetical protein
VARASETQGPAHSKAGLRLFGLRHKKFPG